MLISIIVPVYNVEKYLDKCINSVLDQDYSNFEVILVNDGSTDNSGNICDKYAQKEKRITVIHQDNHGSHYTRKVGFDNARGKYICFIDSDDWLDSDYISSQLTAIEHNGADVILCDYYFNNGEKDMYHSNMPTNIKPKTLICESLECKIHAGLWCKMFKRSFFIDNNIPFPKYSYYEDMFTWISFLHYNPKTAYLNHASYHYRYNPSSLTGNRSLQKRIKSYKEFIGNMEDLDSLYHITNNNRYREALYKSVNINKAFLFRTFYDYPELVKPLLKHFKNSFPLKKIHSVNDLCFYIANRYGIMTQYKILTQLSQVAGVKKLKQNIGKHRKYCG